MTEKEKAKAYDEALKKASAAYKDEDRHLKATLERIFPELKESEDEKIRKEIISILHNAYWTSNRNRFNELVAWLKKQRDKDKLIQELGEYKVKYTQEVLEKHINSMSNKDDERLRKTAIAFLKDFVEQGYENAVECIDWLEKQGKNSTDNTPRFNVGDWVVNKFGDSWHIDSLDKKNYQVSDGKGNYNYFPISKQDEMHLFTIQDAKDGDVLACNEEILLFKSYSAAQGRIYLYCWYNGHTNNFHSKEVIDTLMTTRITPATKEQRDTLMKVMSDAGYEWNVNCR